MHIWEHHAYWPVAAKCALEIYLRNMSQLKVYFSRFAYYEEVETVTPLTPVFKRKTWKYQGKTLFAKVLFTFCFQILVTMIQPPKMWVLTIEIVAVLINLMQNKYFYVTLQMWNIILCFVHKST